MRAALNAYLDETDAAGKVPTLRLCVEAHYPAGATFGASPHALHLMFARAMAPIVAKCATMRLLLFASQSFVLHNHPQAVLMRQT